MVYEIMPMVWMLRLMLMLPLTVLPNGNFRFRWLSVPVALSFATWLVLVVITYYTVRFRLDPVSVDGKHFHVWDLVPKYASSFSLCYIVFMPYTNWALTSRAIDMIEDLKRVQVMIAALHGATRLPRVRALAWAACAVSVGVPVLMQATAFSALPDQAVWMTPVLLHSAAYVTLGTSFWYIACRTVSILAHNVAADMVDDCQRLGVAGLRQHRRIWLGLVKVVYGLSESWGRTQAVLLGAFFVTIVSISFLLTHMVFTNSLNKAGLWLFFTVVLVFLATISTCSAAQTMTDAVRVPAKMQLLLLSFLVRDEETTTEIVQFLEEMYLEHPKVSVCRLGVLSKASIVYIFALANTYIVVLSQFTLSIETSTTNFDVDPGRLKQS
ncbi:gustatory and odorant receptor 24-like [Thrips palmi]|uniref:Gustatory receptor n=1 Tax=Thrips palmi TaxID=161013 RepID=A0A6P8YK53_THRPL|nr:gustatory and odorant receptor 24-like [Thrips palmi]